MKNVKELMKKQFPAVKFETKLITVEGYDYICLTLLNVTEEMMRAEISSTIRIAQVGITVWVVKQAAQQVAA